MDVLPLNHYYYYYKKIGRKIKNVASVLIIITEERQTQKENFR